MEKAIARKILTDHSRLNKRKDFVVNYHMNERCNYRCEYCYAKWDIDDPKKELHNDMGEVQKLLQNIYKYFSNDYQSIRLNLVGGEPSLAKNFKKVIEAAYRIGFKVGIVTNGSLIDEKFIALYSKYISVIGFSIDGSTRDVLQKIGRATVSGEVLIIDEIIHKFKLLRHYNPDIQIKINTVVSKNNFDHDLSPLLSKAVPDKWKVFRVFPNVNPDSEITDAQYKKFLNRHIFFSGIMFPEDNNTMLGSYVMIDPLGRFFDNTCFGNGTSYTYSDPINDVGTEQAFKMINFDKNKFWMRYDNEKLMNDISVSA